MQNIKDRAAGVLMGLAVGDLIGGPVSMAVILAECLFSHGKFDISLISTSYLNWWNSDGFDTGPTGAMFFKLVNSGLSFEEASFKANRTAAGMTAGCNPAHRSSPLAMMPFLRDDALADLAVKEATLTHRHPLAGDVAAATVVLCRALIRGVKWTDGLRIAATGREPLTVTALLDIKTPSADTGGFAPSCA